MAGKTLKDIAAGMADIDIAFLTTTTRSGDLATRPMSNNRDVEYDGDSFYFTTQDSRMVAEIEAEPRVSLSFAGDDGFYVAVSGQAEIIRDRGAFDAHWNEDLDEWFEEGVDTPGLVLIKVRAERLKYWDGEENGEVTPF